MSAIQTVPENYINDDFFEKRREIAGAMSAAVNEKF